MITIPHYERARTAHAHLPRLDEAEYAAACRRETREMVAEVDRNRWRESRLCESFTEQFVRDVAQAETFVDVGAERGFYAYLALKHMPSGGRIVALEPDPARYAILSRLFAGQANVEVHRLAAFDTAGKTTFVKPWGCSATAADVCGDRFEVETVVLDEFLDELSPDIIKIDVEGAEACVLKGMRRVLARGRSRILLEYHPWVEQVTPGGNSLIKQLLAEADYRILRTDTGRLVPSERPGGRMYCVPAQE